MKGPRKFWENVAPVELPLCRPQVDYIPVHHKPSIKHQKTKATPSEYAMTQHRLVVMERERDDIQNHKTKIEWWKLKELQMMEQYKTLTWDKLEGLETWANLETQVRRSGKQAKVACFICN